MRKFTISNSFSIQVHHCFVGVTSVVLPNCVELCGQLRETEFRSQSCKRDSQLRALDFIFPPEAQWTTFHCYLMTGQSVPISRAVATVRKWEWDPAAKSHFFAAFYRRQRVTRLCAASFMFIIQCDSRGMRMSMILIVKVLELGFAAWLVFAKTVRRAHPGHDPKREFE